MRTLFRGLPLDRATVSMTINATAPILTSLLVAVAEENGVPRVRLGGTVQNDILKEYVARGTYIYPPEASIRLAVDLIEFATREMPQWNYISVSGYHMREAGATAVQEVAFTLANAIAYVRAVQARGLDLDEFLPRLVVLLLLGPELPRGDREVPRGPTALGLHRHRQFRRRVGPFDPAPVPHPDRGFDRSPRSSPS